MKEQVGRYKILNQLGKGAMGVVYLADDPLLHRQVAIKTVELAADDPARHDFLRDRLVRDARAAAGLSHPNIVGVYDVFEEDGCGYLVLEYVAGETLAARLARIPLPDAAFVSRVLGEMASALDYTHARGIIHRDIKPSNVMLNPAGTAKIMDFGIARINDSQTRTATGMVMGTVEYMAPEQIKGETVDGRADQFSLAAVAYEMLTASTLFGPQSFTTLAYKLVNEMPPSARSHNPAILPGVDEVLTRALRKTPGERFPSCTAFASALERAFTGEIPASGVVTQVMPTPVMPAAAAVTGKSRGPLIALMSGLIAAVLGVVLMVWRPWVPAFAPPPVNQPVERLEVVEQKKTQPAVTEEPKAEASTPKKSQPEPQAQADPAKASSPVKPNVTATTAPSQVAQPTEPPASGVVDSSFPPAVLDAYHVGEAMVRGNRYPAAIRAFTQVLTQRPDFVPAYLARGTAYLHQNRPADALADFNEVIHRNPRNAVAFSQRGICHARLNDEEGAMADFNRALELRPDIRGALNGRGLIHLRRQRYQMAIHEFNEAIRVSPDFALAYLNRGRAEQALGNMPAAQLDLAKAKELNARKRSEDSDQN